MESVECLMYTQRMEGGWLCIPLLLPSKNTMDHSSSYIPSHSMQEPAKGMDLLILLHLRSIYTGVGNYTQNISSLSEVGVQ